MAEELGAAFFHFLNRDMKRLPRKEKKRRKKAMRKLIEMYGNAFAKYYPSPVLVSPKAFWIKGEVTAIVGYPR